jgi:hypothetical protein
MYAAFGIQHAMRMGHIDICGLSGSTIFFHTSKRHGFRKRNAIEYKTRVLVVSTFVRNICRSNKHWARYRQKCVSVCMWTNSYFLHVTGSYFRHILMKLQFSRQIFSKHSNIKFHENPSNGSRVVPCGQTDGQVERRTANSRFSQFLRRRLKNISLFSTTVLNNMAGISHHTMLLGAWKERKPQPTTATLQILFQKPIYPQLLNSSKVH